MSEATILERRRDALITAAQLQRRNVATRWSHLRRRRSVHWVQSGIDAVSALQRPLVRPTARPLARKAARPWWVVALAMVLPMLAGTRAPFVATALRVVRRPTWWSVGMLAVQWLWRRRRRRIAGRAETHRRGAGFAVPRLQPVRH